MTTHRGMPDWPPTDSASHYAEGHRKHGSTGQLFEVRNHQWVRVLEDAPVREPRPTTDHPGGHL